MTATTRRHDDWLREQLADDEFMLAYLQSALEESTSEAEVLMAIRAVVESRGISRVAEQAGVKRESLSRALSATGNPRLDTLFGVFKALGFRLSVTKEHDHAHA